MNRCCHAEQAIGDDRWFRLDAREFEIEWGHPKDHFRVLGLEPKTWIRDIASVGINKLIPYRHAINGDVVAHYKQADEYGAYYCLELGWYWKILRSHG